MKGEMVSFLGHDYPAYFWDRALAFLFLVALLSLYYSFHWSVPNDV